jgi:uncharacterized surface protein with fasciclin (FAS1) repeats
MGLFLVQAPAAFAQGDIVDIAVADGRFTTLVAAVQQAGLVDTLKSEGPFTVFAPTDDAFAKLPDGLVTALLHDVPALTNILLYHVIPGEVMAADVKTQVEESGEVRAATVQGSELVLTAEDGQLMIGDAQVIIEDIQASNGVIHVVDTVLLPPTGAGENDYVVQPGDTLYGIASQLLGDGSRYMEIVYLTNAKHATDPSYPMIDNPNLLHINWKLAIPQTEESITIVDYAVADERFSTLVTALTEASLVETLQGEGPFTVFAPTNEAFGKLPEGTVEALLADVPALTEVLLYHVVAGGATERDVRTQLDANTEFELTTVQGDTIRFSEADGKIMVNDATVTVTNIWLSNGVIHVIDTVLLPPQS